MVMDIKMCDVRDRRKAMDTWQHHCQDALREVEVYHLPKKKTPDVDDPTRPAEKVRFIFRFLALSRNLMDRSPRTAPIAHKCSPTRHNRAGRRKGRPARPCLPRPH